MASILHSTLNPHIFKVLSLDNSSQLKSSFNKTVTVNAALVSLHMIVIFIAVFFVIFALAVAAVVWKCKHRQQPAAAAEADHVDDSPQDEEASDANPEPCHSGDHVEEKPTKTALVPVSEISIVPSDCSNETLLRMSL